MILNRKIVLFILESYQDLGLIEFNTVIIIVSISACFLKEHLDFLCILGHRRCVSNGGNVERNRRFCGRFDHQVRR